MKMHKNTLYYFENGYYVKMLTKVETSQNAAVKTPCKLGKHKTITKHMGAVGSRGQRKMVAKRLVCVCVCVCV